MRKLLSSPVKMSLSDIENQIYQNTLKHVPEITLNLMAIKVENHPSDFVGWCKELYQLCKHKLNIDLLDPPQFQPLKKLQDTLMLGVSVSQLKMLRIAPWPIFAAVIDQLSEHQALDERLRLMAYLQPLQASPLSEMIEEDRLAFAGKHTNKHDVSVFNFDVEWFGSTKGAKTFHQLLQLHTSEFDQALDFIPHQGMVTPKQYQDFVSAYCAIFARHTRGEQAPLMPATRLLAMKRPDQFIALTNAKIDPLCQGLGISKISNRDFNGYWHELIGTLRTFAWWHQDQPENEEERELWEIRAILVDLFFFADEDTPLQSNLIRIRDKALIAKSHAKPALIKRGQQSAESLVDKALADDELPHYLQDKRDSIIKEVKNGKSVESVINTMRAIFG